MEKSVTSFGQWVRERRKQRGLTQKTLGQLVNYAEITVRQIERDAYPLTRFVVECFISSLAYEIDDTEAITRFALGQSIGIPAEKGEVYGTGTPFIGRKTELEQIISNHLTAE